MSDDAIAAGKRLADILVRENDALRRVDYAAAVALVPDKEAALAALADHGIQANFPPPLARQLRDVAAENHELLTLAIKVQTRVVQIVARAYAPPKSENRYSARAGKPAPQPALALSTRA
jgi:hypothetical protein